MKFIESLAKKFTKTVSSEAKKEIKKTAIDLLPGTFAIITTIAGIFIFKGQASNSALYDYGKPLRTNTTITNNNYFFNEVSEETILKFMMLDDDD